MYLSHTLFGINKKIYTPVLYIYKTFADCSLIVSWYVCVFMGSDFESKRNYFHVLDTEERFLLKLWWGFHYVGSWQHMWTTVQLKHSGAVLSKTCTVESWCLWFGPFVVILIPLFWPFMTVSDEWGMRRYGWPDTFSCSCCCPDQSSCLSLSDGDCFHAFWTETILESCNIFYASKKHILLILNFLVFMHLEVVYLLPLFHTLEPNNNLCSSILL
jgi:hypothetical protein